MGANLYILSSYTEVSETDKQLGFYLINTLVGLMTIPSLIIFANYLRYSVNREIQVKGRQINFIHRGTVVECRVNAIKVVSAKHSRFPWSNFTYLQFCDHDGKQIFITFFVINAMDLKLAMRTAANNIDWSYEVEYYPLIS